MATRSKNSFVVKNPLYKSKDETLIGLRIPLTNPVDIPKPKITSMNLILENVDSRLPFAIQVVRKAINAPDRNPDAATNEPNSKGKCSGCSNRRVRANLATSAMAIPIDPPYIVAYVLKRMLGKMFSFTINICVIYVRRDKQTLINIRNNLCV